jgi:hypothetical protein
MLCHRAVTSPSPTDKDVIGWADGVGDPVGQVGVDPARRWRSLGAGYLWIDEAANEYTAPPSYS